MQFDCQAEKKADAIGALVLVKIASLFLFAFIGYVFSNNKAEVNSLTAADKEEVYIPDAELILNLRRKINDRAERGE